jgi:isopentenyl diphosphate isomerase/L-lactate dehydrogenase-like FMN-dependent dehydrogenase
MASLDRLYNLEQVRLGAKRVLPRVLFDYIDGDAEDGTTRRANRAGYERLTLRQQVPTSVAKADLSVEVLGRTLSMPVIVAPCGLAAMVHPDGPIGANRAAAGRGTISVLSTVAGTSPAELAAEVDEPGWFQLYAPGGRDSAEPLIEEVQRLGFSALVVTTDTAVLGRRERDLSHGITMPLHLSPRVAAGLAAQVAARPVWLGRLLKDQVERRRAVASGTSTRAASRPTVPGMGASPFTWEDIAWIRTLWEGPLLVKGLVTADDARRARDAGAQGVVVSNHGGRQLDGAPATIDALPAVVEAVGDDIEVLVDGGVRRGTDIIKALSLGASAVQIGRPWLFGLAVAGQPGVEHVLRLLRRELRNALSLMDVTAVRDLDRSHLL